MNYGLDRDFSARFNASGYHPFTAYTSKDTGPSPEQLAATEADAQEKKRAMWRAAWARQKAKATRVNPSASLGYATGMAKQVQEIKEARRAA